MFLNTEIEVAGEQGLEFAMVADEIRELSSKTSKVTGSIANLIKDIQEKSNIGLEYIKEVELETKKGKKISKITGTNWQI